MSTKIFLDTNVLLYSKTKTASQYQTSVSILRNLVDHHHVGVISPYVINEFHYYLLRKYDRAFSKQKTIQILSLPQVFLTDLILNQKDIISITSLAHKYHLSTTDAFHAYYCKKLKIRTIATFDTDFARIPWLTTIPTQTPQSANINA